MVPRTALLRQLEKHDATDEIKVLIGVRRCGKSTLLCQYRQKLTDAGMPQSNIFFKRFDDFTTPLDYSAKDLYRDLEQSFAKADETQPFYVFLDEIQDVPGWERIVRRLHTRSRTRVFITGSNAQLLSGDLATYLAGRYLQIPVYPLSFAEYLDYRGLLGENATANTDYLSDYMRFGGMPGLLKYGLPDETQAREALDDIYQSIVVKDVAEHNSIRDIPALNKISRYLFSTSGNLFSTRKVANTLRSAGTDVAPKTVESDIAALEHAFIIHRAKQEGIAGKRILRPTNKYYPVDNGFRNLANGFAGKDIGAQLEGVVYMELRRRGYAVTVGTGANSEVDFVARRGPKKQYIQVTLSMLEEGTREREIGALQSLTDAFPRTVITLDPLSAGVTDDGIRIVHAPKWLTEQN
ncbi:ATP-binding protein [Bifidobacterium sp. ESL0800]|uniref:ATP-binding protein n=1 Tax=Bifidobacterium sp. ESL0800 TaxID=2983236 RepID=UPI0023F72DEE|nr:ATP-binding protein [Bifidobacterium sp. ESL0800]WEV75788.1 ATP-binding protein [Bifidobacterium sp. ESL0800]